jgi:O-antigen/teichoic acid export membrane protein
LDKTTLTFKKILRKFQILSVSKKYIVFDWIASSISFICTWYIYHESSDMESLGHNGWVLSLLTTSLFVSSAAQYYMMFRKQNLFYTYLYFLPIMIIEIIILSFLVQGIYLILISISLLSNVFFAAFRGSFMAKGEFPKAAICNILEQLLRLILIFILAISGLSLSKSLLLGSSIVYIALTTIVLLYKVYKKDYKETIFNKNGFKEAFKFAIVSVGIYILMNGDVLSLKNFSEIKGQFVLLKPWGQVFIVVLTPLINLFLWKLENNKSTKSIYLSVLALFLTFSFSGMFFGKEINILLFNKSDTSNVLIEIIIIEHLFIALILAILYRILDLKINYSKALQIVILSVLFLISIPYILSGNYVFLGYLGLYSILFVLYRKSLFIKNIFN